MRSDGGDSPMGGGIRTIKPGFHSLPSKGSVRFRASSFDCRDANKGLQTDHKIAARFCDR